MIKKTWKTVSLFAFCGAVALASPAVARADEIAGPGLSLSNYIATVDAETVNINADEGEQNVLLTASKGAEFQVMEDMGDGWVKVKVKDTYGFLPLDGNATITQADEAAVAALDAAYEEATNAAADFRQGVVNYALQFVGGRYSYGGSDPHTGVDCSGFVRYVLQHAAGISLSRSSNAQAFQGKAESADQMKPGDLIFYGSGKSINHVAMYIGNGQVVHSSTYKTGIKASPWNYRMPIKIVNVIGD